MTSWALLFALMLPGQADALAPVGQLTGSAGEVTISRDGGATRGATNATSLQSGDTITTGPGAVALASIKAGASIYVGSQTQVGLRTPAQGPQVVLSRGEIRVVNSRIEKLTVLTPAVEAQMGAGVLRGSITTAGTRFCAMNGNAKLRSREEQASLPRRVMKFVSLNQPDDKKDGWLILKEGQQILFETGKGFGVPSKCNSDDWTIDTQQILVAIGQSRALASQTQTRNVDQGPADDATSSSDQQNQQQSGTGGVNFTLGSTLASTSASSAGGLFTDANQNTLAGKLTRDSHGLAAGSAFPGNIHLITGETSYLFRDVFLAPADLFVTGTEFWSIGLGAVPTSQISTGIGTGTRPIPDAVAVPGFGAYVVRLDQFGVVDPASPAAVGNQSFAVTGLTGTAPFNPEIIGATPLTDARSANQINPRATFALGEFAVSQTNTQPKIAMRRSDQDRRIIKDQNGDDREDLVTPNQDVTQFHDVADPRFFPQNSSVKTPATGPNAISNLPTYSSSSLLRQAAFTTLTAEKLKGFSQRTGQTRFVIDGKIVDITGYQGR